MSKSMIQVLDKVADAVISSKDYLTELDAQIGDADHGINMARGFTAVKEKIKTLTGKDAATILKAVGMALISTVGGASGPLYGTAFIRAANLGKDKYEIDAKLFSEMLLAAIDGIKERGKSQRGEKTMLDALIPAYEAYVLSLHEGESMADCLQAAASAAHKGLEYTKTIIATKGRASYLGERSIGHEDPGAASSALILSTMAQIVVNSKNTV